MEEFSSDSAEVADLLRQVRAGKTQAFEALFARHRAYLHQVIALRMDPRLRARVDPSDVVQETHLEAYRRLPDYLQRLPMPFRVWLRKTAYERLLFLRRQHVEAERRSVGREVAIPDASSLLLAEQFLADGSTPSQTLAKHELARQVRQAVAQLSEADQEVVLMRTFEGLSNQEIGFILDLDPGTVSKRYGRALLRLHQLLANAAGTEL
jgi:RNA polymerase sigma-70 factor (ECF subfamily)